MNMQILFRRKTVDDELTERPDDDVDVWVAENGNTTDVTPFVVDSHAQFPYFEETMADLVESIIGPYVVKKRAELGLPPLQHALLIVDGTGSHRRPKFKEACRKYNIGKKLFCPLAFEFDF